MSRASTLARVLRDLKEERDEVSERKSAYDYDTNRAVVALSKFTRIVEKASSPDMRRSQQSSPPPEDQGQPPPQEQGSEQTPEDSADEVIPQWARKAYRAIALKTHPDKVNADDSITDTQRDRLVSLYKEATTAYREKNYEALAEVATELEIEVEIPIADLEKALESKVRSVRVEIANMQKTLSWHWGISFGDTPKRIQVLKGCCRVMNIPTPDDSVLSDIIREIESQPEFDIIDRLGKVRRIKSGADRRKLGTRPEKRIR
jgi:hypothetical protein